MNPAPKPARLIRFGVFEVDMQTGELAKKGRKVHIQDQPLRLLAVLLERPGELRTREELQRLLWPDGTNVDFDHGLNVTVKKLREALGDSATSPRYIETLPRHGYRFLAPLETAGESSPLPDWTGTEAATPIEKPPRVRQVLAIAIALALVAGALYAWWARRAQVRWARMEAPAEIERLVEQDRFHEAYRLAVLATRAVPGDYHLNRLLEHVSAYSTVTSTPAGAEMFIREYMTPEAEWGRLGELPLENFPIPISYFRFRITKDGYETVDGALLGIFHTAVHFDLQPSGSGPPGMVFIPAGSQAFGAENQVQLDDFWMDSYEVTNREFRAFVDARGYERQEYWNEPVVREGEVLRWKEAIALFRDQSGRPGPATWELGRFPEGTGDYPVNGISWYEAAAYSEFAGKNLPTVYHWARAAGLHGRGQGVLVDLRPLSNFAGDNLSAVGTFDGMSPYGTYDMGGNVKEWCWNEVACRRFILGGAWSEPAYMFGAGESLPPLSRAATHGFRCMKPVTRVPEALLAPVREDTLSRDLQSERPVDDATFEQYLNLYAYDRTDLNPRVEEVDDRHPDWRRERVSFDAAYGEERVPAYLYLPRNTDPPYQAVVHYPGGEAASTESSRHLTLTISFIIRSGRAAMLPIYKGHYERRIDRSRLGTDFFRSFASRDLALQQAKDLSRAVDYLETRPDIDADKLAYQGISAGAVWGPVFTAVERRFRASILLAGGMMRQRKPPEVEPLNFAPRAKVPVLMINGREDSLIPHETLQLPLFRLLGAPARDRRLALFDSGHIPPRLDIIREVLAWLDRYLGPVAHADSS